MSALQNLVSGHGALKGDLLILFTGTWATVSVTSLKLFQRKDVNIGFSNSLIGLKQVRIFKHPEDDNL